MGKLRRWRRITDRATVCDCDYLCEVGDWAWDCGTGKGDGVGEEFIANKDQFHY